jgi:hypothetical protein
MFCTVAVIPEARHVTVAMHDDSEGRDRLRVIHLGPSAVDSLTIHVQNRAVLDALQAALDEIRADTDREETAEIAGMAPGEIVEAYGK